MKYKLYFELLWWMITLVILLLFLVPIYLNIGDAYPFYRDNILVIIIAVTFVRYIFLLKHHWLTISNWAKAIFMILPIPLFFYLLGVIYDFQRFADEEGIRSVLGELPYTNQAKLALFIKTEMIFFWASAFITNLMMPFRMIISVWRKINKGTE